MPISVKLQPYEYALVLDVSNRRQIMSMAKGDRDSAGYDSHRPESYKDQTEGVAAEMAVAKYLGIYWDGSVGTYHDVPDLLDCIEVKWCRSDEKPQIVIRPSSKEKSEHYFVLVTGCKGEYTIHGWHTKKWIEDNVPLTFGDPRRPAARFCSAEMMSPMEKMKSVVANRFLANLFPDVKKKAA